MSASLNCRFRHIDAGFGRQCRRPWKRVLEAIWMPREGVLQDLIALIVDDLCHVIVHSCRRHVADPGVPMVIVVPSKERLAEGTRFVQRVEPLGEAWPILHRLELRFRVRVIVGRVRAAMAFDDVEIDKQIGDQLEAIGLYTTHCSRSAASVAADTRTSCMPSQMVLTPGSPSLFRPMKPPNRATNRSTSFNVGIRSTGCVVFVNR